MPVLNESRHSRSVDAWSVRPVAELGRGAPAALRLGERMLLALSRPPGSADYQTVTADWRRNDPLSLLQAQFPDLLQRVAGKRVLDYGCGAGHQVVALAQRGAAHVTGLDTSPPALRAARQLASEAGVGRRVELVAALDERLRDAFDVIVSQNAMEHFPDPASTLAAMAMLLKPGGVILMTFGPPWFAPYGHHMFFFTKMPWVNLLFSERTVMRVRSLFRSDGATRYEDVAEGLNRMSVRKFEGLVARSGLEMRHRHYRCVKRLDFLARVPLARELFINHISCVLARRA